MNSNLSGVWKKVALVTMLSLGLAAPAAAELDPGQVQVSLPSYPIDLQTFQPQLGEYTYEVSWQGIPAAELRVSVNKDDAQFHVVASAKTFSGIDMLYKLRYRAEGTFSAHDLAPIKTVIDQRENSKQKITEIDFHEGGNIQATRQTGDEDPKFVSFNSTSCLDPFAAAFIARSFDWKLGETHRLDTFNGRSRYLISLTAIDREEIYVDGVKRSAWVIEPKVDKLTDPGKNHKLRSAKIYLSDDSNRDVLQIVSSVFIGSVKTKLESYKAPGTQEQPQVVAQKREPARRIFVE
jgi:hypothetical protein